MSGYNSDEDEDLKRAIALSLGEGMQPDSQKLIDLTSDDDVEKHEMKEKSNAIAGMPQKGEIHGSIDAKTREATTHSVDKIDYSTKIEAPRFGILALDRKKMEEERLARIRKRKASISPPPSRNSDSRISKAPKLSSNPAISIPPLGQLSESRVKSTQGAPAGPMSYIQQQTALQATGIQYPKGVVKKTWAHGYPRENDIKIEACRFSEGHCCLHQFSLEVLQKNDLELAVLSAYQWDDQWLGSKLDMSKTKLICVVQSEDEAHRNFMRANAPPGIRYIFPSMEGQINIMHSKLQLLSHPTHLRICVPSANLVPYDWGESGGFMENVVFLIDLPRLPHGNSSLDDLPPFATELMYFLKALGMDESTIQSLLKFDFTQTRDLAFVHTIGGAHSGDAYKRTGYCGLSAAIRGLGLSTSELELDYVAASIGSLNEKFLAALFLAAQGDDGMTEYKWRYEKAKVKSDEEQNIVKKMYSCFRVYFPTKSTALESKGSAGAAGNICFQSNWWDSNTFPRSIFRDCHSQRARMLMHNKILFARPCSNTNTSKFIAWAYIGSSNLSASAWGALVKDRTTRQPKMNCRNWECGVIVPVPAPQKTMAGTTKAEMLGMDIFDGFVPVPMKVPGEKYGSRRPWFFREG